MRPGSDPGGIPSVRRDPDPVYVVNEMPKMSWSRPPAFPHVSPANGASLRASGISVDMKRCRLAGPPSGCHHGGGHGEADEHRRVLPVAAEGSTARAAEAARDDRLGGARG